MDAPRRIGAPAPLGRCKRRKDPLSTPSTKSWSFRRLARPPLAQNLEERYPHR
jgi:hypothetical protein